MCKWGKHEIVAVWIPANLSRNDLAGWHQRKIDKCIAPIVDALQKGGINMVASCCGHGKAPGLITLVDGREVYIFPGNKEE